MHWNLEELMERVSKLEELMLRENNLSKKASIKKDINTLLGMIDYISGRNKYVKKRDDYGYNELYYKSDLNDMLNAVKNSSDSIIKTVAYIPHDLHFTSPFVTNKRIKDDEYFELVDSFFKQYDSDHLRLYRNLIDSHNIELNSNIYLEQRLKGICIPILNEPSIYLLSRFDGRINSSETLVHEVGHAYQFEGISDLRTDEYTSFSVFREAYAMFIEFVYYDYLKNTKYRKNAKSMEASLIDRFYCPLEFYADKLLDLKDSTIRETYFEIDKDKKLSTDDLRNYYSGILAIYLINSYRKDKNKTMKEIEKINCYYKNREEERLLYLHTPYEYSSSFSEVIRNLRR